MGQEEEPKRVLDVLVRCTRCMSARCDFPQPHLGLALQLAGEAQGKRMWGNGRTDGQNRDNCA